MFEIYNAARHFRDDPELDHIEYLRSLDISEEQLQIIVEQLEASQVSIPTVLSQNCRGVYSHYLTQLSGKYGNDVSGAIDENVKDTRRRMVLRECHPERAAYGLVMGRIQSGKTAHMIGVSLHSIDPEQSENTFDLVIILAGLIEDLRVQTNHRYSEAIDHFDGKSPLVFPGVDSDLSSTDMHLTDKLRESLHNLENKRMVLVIKKNHLVLKTLYDIVLNCNIPTKRILIIDDESDYASTDTGRFDTELGTGEILDDDPSETNRVLRQLIRHFNLQCSDCMYLGYTATPFANLLSPESLHALESDSGLSLFPRDFVHSLKGSDSHLDNQTYFAEPDCPNVLSISSFDGGESQEKELVTDSIYRHIVTEIVKLNRGLDSHHTTLIHTSREVEDHKRLAELTREIIEHMMSPSQSNAVCNNLIRILQEYRLGPEEIAQCESKIQILNESRRKYMFTLSEIKVIEVNSRRREMDEISERNLRYQHGKRSYIAIGGTRLSRGLTLEGLTTSLFVRTSQVPRYDTMMQMSRWCGYRQNGSGDSYADMVRIITTEEIAGNMRDIAIAEADLRRKIENIPWNETPLEQPDGLWIIETPGMAVTADEKMQHVRRRTWGRMGTLPIWSYKCPVLYGESPSSKAQSMFDRARIFLEDIQVFGLNAPPSGARNFTIARGIPADWVLSYMRAYREMYAIDDDSTTVQNLDRLINEEYWENTEWTIAIHTPNRERTELIAGMQIGLVNRSKRSNQEIAAIASNGGSDTAIDLDTGEFRTHPLLLIYFVDPDSTQLNEGIERVFHQSVNRPVPIWGVCMPQPMIEEGGSEVRGGL